MGGHVEARRIGANLPRDGTLLVLQHALLIGTPIPFLSRAALMLVALSLAAAGAFFVKR